MGFSRQEYWSGLPFPFPEDHPDRGWNKHLLHCRQILHCLSHQAGREAPVLCKGPKHSLPQGLCMSPSFCLEWSYPQACACSFLVSIPVSLTQEACSQEASCLHQCLPWSRDPCPKPASRFSVALIRGLHLSLPERQWSIAHSLYPQHLPQSRHTRNAWHKGSQCSQV